MRKIAGLDKTGRIYSSSRLLQSYQVAKHCAVLSFLLISHRIGLAVYLSSSREYMSVFNM